MKDLTIIDNLQFLVEGFESFKGLSIGFIDYNNNFQKNEKSYLLLENLRNILFSSYRVNQRGSTHPCCPLCNSLAEAKKDWPSNCRESTVLKNHHNLNEETNIRYGYIILPHDKQHVFIAPSMIYHYVNFHHYSPPEIFVEALNKYGKTL